MSYSVDVCDCNNVGNTIETLASASYADDATPVDDHPLMPDSLAIEVMDSSQFCGVPYVALGERLARDCQRNASPAGAVAVASWYMRRLCVALVTGGVLPVPPKTLVFFKQAV